MPHQVLSSIVRPARVRSSLKRIDQAFAAARVSARGGWCKNDQARRIYVNLGDLRGLELARKRGCLDPKLARVWRELVARERPTLVVDVGTNYGEIALSASYPDAREIILIEPNPLVLPFLRRTVAGWSDPRVRLEECAAGSGTDFLSINLCPTWSGTTSMVRAPEDSFPAVVAVKPLADLLPPNDGTTLIKVDVEGAELSVLAGLRGHQCQRLLALVEHEHLSSDELSELANTWDMSAIDRTTGELIALERGGLARLPQDSILRDLVMTPSG